MVEEKQLAQELEVLKKRLQALEDKEAIRDVLVRYYFNADLNRTDAFLDLWTEDAIKDVGTQFGVWKGKQ